MRTKRASDLRHIFRNENRIANVFMTEKGYEVDLYEEDKLIETRKLHKHSESYAEDCGENWVMRLF